MPTCKYCQKHVGFWEGGTFARLHPACSVELGRLDRWGRRAFDALTVSEREQYGDLDAAARIAFLEPKRLELEAQWLEEEEQRVARRAKEEARRAAEEAQRTAEEHASNELHKLAMEVAVQGTYDVVRLRPQIGVIASAAGMSAEEVDGALAGGWEWAHYEATGNAQSMAELNELLGGYDDHAEAQQVFLGAVRLSDDDLRDKTAEKRWAVQERLQETITDAAFSGDELVLEALDVLLKETGLSNADQNRILADVWQTVVPAVIVDGLPSEEDEGALGQFMEYFDLDVSDLSQNGAMRKFLHAAILGRAIDGDWDNFGDMSQSAVEEGHQIPFNLLKSETLVWLARVAHYSTLETRREFRGSSHGLSIRVAKGLYYRPSSFSGRSVASEEVTHADTGMLGITTKHLYFHGPVKRFRVRYDKIVSFEPYSDGIGFMRDNLRAKPETFTVSEDDGWFLYNLVTNLARQ